MRLVMILLALACASPGVTAIAIGPAVPVLPAPPAATCNCVGAIAVGTAEYYDSDFFGLECAGTVATAVHIVAGEMRLEITGKECGFNAAWGFVCTASDGDHTCVDEGAVFGVATLKADGEFHLVAGDDSGWRLTLDGHLQRLV